MMNTPNDLELQLARSIAAVESGPRSVYISASREDVRRAKSFQVTLRMHGARVLCPWWDSIPPTDIGTPHDVAVRAAREDVEAIDQCDVFVYFDPPEGKGRGSHVELGYALARRRTHGAPLVIVVGDTGASIFTKLADVHVPNASEAVRQTIFGGTGTLRTVNE